MFIKQISVFVENKAGRISDVLTVLGDNNIDISALSIADSSDYGVVRMIVNNIDLAVEKLREHGVIVRVTEVIAVPIDDRPGGLSLIMNIMKEEGISVSYLYAFLGKSEKATVVFKVDKPEEAIEVLRKNNIDA